MTILILIGITKSKQLISFEQRSNIRPLGVISKNSEGQCMMLLKSRWNTLDEACKVAVKSDMAAP